MKKKNILSRLVSLLDRMFDHLRLDTKEGKGEHKQSKHKHNWSKYSKMH